MKIQSPGAHKKSSLRDTPASHGAPSLQDSSSGAHSDFPLGEQCGFPHALPPSHHPVKVTHQQ